MCYVMDIFFKFMNILKIQNQRNLNFLLEIATIY